MHLVAVIYQVIFGVGFVLAATMVFLTTALCPVGAINVEFLTMHTNFLYQSCKKAISRLRRPLKAKILPLVLGLWGIIDWLQRCKMYSPPHQDIIIQTQCSLFITRCHHGPGFGQERMKHIRLWLEMIFEDGKNEALSTWL